MEKGYINMLSQRQNQYLCRQYSQKHGERIDRSVTNGRCITGGQVIGVSQCRRIGSRTSQNPDKREIIQLAIIPSYQSCNQKWQDGYDYSVAYPYISSAMNDCVYKAFACS